MMEKELGSKRKFVINEDGSISFFTDKVSDEVRAQAEAERDRLLAKRDKAANAAREVGTPEVKPKSDNLVQSLKDMVSQVK